MANGTTATFSMIAQLQNETPAQFRQLTENMRNTANAPGMRDLPSRFNDLTALAGSTAQNIQQILLPALSQLGIRSLTAAGIVTGTFVGAHKISQEAIGLRNLSNLTGDSLEDLDKMHKGWKAAGGELDEINDALMKGAQIKSQWQAGPLKNSIGLAAQVTDILVEAGHAPLIAQLGKLIADDKRGGSGTLLGIVKLVKEAESDPIIQAMIFGKMGLSPLFAAIDIDTQYKAATAGTQAAQEATEEYEKVWNEMATEMINLRNTIFNAIGPGLTGSLRIMNLAFSDPPRLWRIMVLSIQAITPDWIKRLFGWQGSAAQGPPDPVVAPGGGAPGLRPRSSFRGGVPQYAGGYSRGGTGGDSGAMPLLTPEATGGAKMAAGATRGVHPELVDIVNEASKSLPEGYTARIESGARPGSPGYHGHGGAADVRIYGPDGKPVGGPGGWYQDPKTFRLYEQLAQAAKSAQVRKYPHGPGFAWGGYFTNKGPGSYGFADSMHFQRGGPMAGGTWAGGARGINKQWLERGGGTSKGMGAAELGGAAPVDPAAAAAFNERFGGGGGGAVTGGSAYLANLRAPFREQLKDPETRKLLGAIISAENVGAGPAVAESLMNRTMLVNEDRARKGLPPLTLRDMMIGHPSIAKGKSFYGPIRGGSIAEHLQKMNNPEFAGKVNRLIDQALGGSDVIEGHTDQGSAGDPNYEAGGVGININRERFNDWGYRGSREFRERLQREKRAAADRAVRAPDAEEKLLTYGQGALDRALRRESNPPETVEGSANIKVITAGPRGVRQSRDVFKRPVLSRSQQMGFAKTESIAPDPAHAGEDQ